MTYRSSKINAPVYIMDLQSESQIGIYLPWWWFM